MKWFECDDQLDRRTVGDGQDLPLLPSIEMLQIYLWAPPTAQPGPCEKLKKPSMTMQPLAAAFGLISRELVAPVDRNRRSVPEKSNVARSRTDICSPRKLIERPPEAAEARGITSEVGNPRRSNNRNISLPTLPVAPRGLSL